MSILGIDIGGTNTKIAIGDENSFYQGSPVILKTILPLEPFLDSIFKKYLDASVEKIGISIAANVNSEGVIVNATNLKIETPMNLKSYVEEKTGRVCRVINDGNASAIAVANMEEFKNYSSIVAVTLGTGIGGGIVLNGKVLTSKSGLDSEIGHITVHPNGKKCKCGSRGCVEVYCGEKGIVERYNERSKIKINSVRDLNKLLLKGDSAAKEVTIETGEMIGQALTVITNILGVEIFTLGGGVCGLGTPLIETIQKHIRKNCFGSKLGVYPKIKVIDNAQFLPLKGAMRLFNE